MQRIPMLGLVVAGTLATLAPRPAAAGAPELGDAVAEATGNNYRGWAIGKLTTWKVGKACAAKLQKPEGRPLTLISSASLSIAAFAKHVTGDDWATLEGSGTSEKIASKPIVEPKVAAFGSKFSLTVSIDGDDCDDGHDPLWMQYVMHAVENIVRTPPVAGKAFVTIDVSSKAKGFAIAVSKDGATFKITAPKEIPPAKWQDEMGRAFAKVAKK